MTSPTGVPVRTTAPPWSFFTASTDPARAGPSSLLILRERMRTVSVDFSRVRQVNAGRFSGWRMLPIFLSRMLASLRLEPCFLVGPFHGRYAGPRVLAGRHGDKVAGMVLSCTHKGQGLADTEPLAPGYASRIEERQKMDDEAFGALRTGNMLPGFPGPGDFGFFWQESPGTSLSIRSAAVAWRCSGWTPRPLLSGLTQPCLVLSARNDRVVAPEKSERTFESDIRCRRAAYRTGRRRPCALLRGCGFVQPRGG